MNPPSAGLDPPGRRSRAYTDEDLTSATQRPYGRGNGVVVAAARTPRGASLTNRWLPGSLTPR
jgi:hypothetical protein